jgi:hypothetical protein
VGHSSWRYTTKVDWFHAGTTARGCGGMWISARWTGSMSILPDGGGLRRWRTKCVVWRQDTPSTQRAIANGGMSVGGRLRLNQMISPGFQPYNPREFTRRERLRGRCTTTRRPSVNFIGYRRDGAYHYAGQQQVFDLYNGVPITARLPLNERPGRIRSRTGRIGQIDDGVSPGMPGGGDSGRSTGGASARSTCDQGAVDRRPLYGVAVVERLRVIAWTAGCRCTRIM